jgi:hypothetical protein
MPLSVVTKCFNGQPVFKFCRISSSGCRQNRKNIVKINIFLDFFFWNIKNNYDNSSNNEKILMQLDMIFKGINELPEFNFGEILSISCYDNCNNV